jgi:hypothetical protein
MRSAKTNQPVRTLEGTGARWRAPAVGLVAAALALSACTIVAPGNPDGGVKIVPVPIRPDALPPPKPLDASVLYVVNLERSSANLADQYAAIMIGLGSYLQSIGLQIDNFGVIATYPDVFGARLLLGRTQPTDPGAAALLGLLAAAGDAGATDYAALLPLIASSLGNISDVDLPSALKLLASSGRFDGDSQSSEAKNVIEFGNGIGAAPLPVDLGGLDRSALFDRPRDLFIVVYLQPLGRRCALGGPNCLVDGRAPNDVFTDVAADGSLTWLKYPVGTLRPEQVVQVAIATTEGEPIDTFRKRCAAIPGFPKNLFDVIAPSDNSYFTPLMQDLNSAHRGTGAIGDFCSLIGAKPDDAIHALGNSVAAVAGSITPAGSSSGNMGAPPPTLLPSN